MSFISRSSIGRLVLALGMAALFFSVQCSQAQQENPLAPTHDTDTIKPQPVCAEPDLQPVCFSAPVYEMLGPVVRARGGVLFTRGKLRINASDVQYDLEKQEGKLHNVSFTTCSCENPDYHLTAKEATLLPNYMLRVTNVALYIGKARVLMLPWMKLRIGGRNATANIFPRVGYDDRDGFTLSQTFRVTDTTRSRTELDLAFTTLHSVQGALRSRYGVGGKLTDMPGRFLTYGSMRARALDFPQPPNMDCDPQLLRPTNVARLQPFGVFTIRQRTYDAKNTSLVLYRQPEVGATWFGHQLSMTKGRLDPRIELYPQMTASIGRYKEIPGHEEYLDRYQIAGQGGINSLWLGPSTAVQPLGLFTYAKYGNGQVYKTFGAGLDVAHITRNGSFLGARYVARSASGSTPFIFDSIDIAKELDLLSMVYFGNNAIGLALTYDADNSTLYDWAVTAGRRSDCLATYLRWNNRYRRFSMDVTLIIM